MDRFSLAGKVAVVTGGSRGLGAFAASVLAEAGASVALLGRDEGALQTVAADVIAASGCQAVSFVAEVTDSASVDLAAQQVLSAFGRVDILVNNAGIVTHGAFMETSDADWDRVIATNLTGIQRVTRAFAVPMIAAGYGRIVSISSLIANRAVANRSSYCASKAGLEHLGRALAVELGPHGITVNCLAPSAIKTDLNREAMEVTQADAYARLLERVPIGRWGEAEDLAGTLIFLASDASAYVTGQSIYVDGGLSIT
ncbi:SDR family NAD(P)-dependent oxidoreductase [Novosphingobium sp.]|uniref:SDR family NAD(P)-dependent oxidoreductase n=1 Tax=Novosphingobium sp. TaxID=1874826 RepID=UPI00286E7BDE|nr:SDR family NAD(P)-dependent oxidoreductase [Novosphingobium sp.]